MGLFDPPKEVMERLDPEGQPNERMRREAQKCLAHYRANKAMEWALILFGVVVVLLICGSLCAAIPAI